MKNRKVSFNLDRNTYLATSTGSQNENIDVDEIWYKNEDYCKFKKNAHKLACRIRTREKHQHQARKWVRSVNSSNWLGDFSAVTNAVTDKNSDIASAANAIATTLTSATSTAFSTTTNNNNDESYIGVVERAHYDMISTYKPERNSNCSSYTNNSNLNNKQFELQPNMHENHYGEQQEYCSLIGILSFWWYSLTMETAIGQHDDDDDDEAEDECCYGFGIERMAIRVLFEDTKIRREDVVDMVLYLQTKAKEKRQHQQQEQQSSHCDDNEIDDDATMKVDQKRRIQHEENIRQCSEYLSLPNRCMARFRAKILEGALYYPDSDIM